MKLANIALVGVSTLIGITKIDPSTPIKPTPLDNEGVIVNFYNESYYGAFSNSSDTLVRFKFELCTSDHYFYVKYYNARTNALVISESYRIWDYLVNGTYMAITLRTKNRLNSDGLKIEFATGTEAHGLQKIKTVYLYPTSNNTIYSYQYVNSPYTTTNQIFKIESSDIKNRESVRFENTIDYLTNNAFNAIDISEIGFTYDEGFELVNKTSNMYLRILDIDGVYNYLTRDAQNNIYVPLKCEQSGVDITLKYLNNFYYNPKTLDLSFTARDGYQETDKFYIPKSKLKLLENATFAVELREFGRSKMNIVIPLTFIKDRNYLGMCNDSNHCIIGGIRE